MNQDELRQRVSETIASTWPEFQAEHPALSQVIDQIMLSEHVVESLVKDDEFKDAYERAVAAKVGARAFSTLMSRFVAAVVHRLT